MQVLILAIELKNRLFHTVFSRYFSTVWDTFLNFGLRKQHFNLTTGQKPVIFVQDGIPGASL
jgi:hypothetical protein